VNNRTLALATVGGVVLGIAYTLSPLSVWFALGFGLLCRTAVRDLSGEERRAILTIVIVAAVLRVAVVGALFATTDHSSVPFGNLFGDEEYYKRRSLWLRSMALDVDISAADRRYAVDEYSETSYLYILSGLQVLVGAAPYGVHLFSIFLYLAGAVLMHRFTRRTFGPAPAAVALTGILFLPTLFLWSVSALRESLHFLLVALAIVGGVEAATEERRARRVLWASAALIAIVLLKDLRVGTIAVVLASIGLGIVAAVAVRSARRAMAVCLIAIAITVAVASRPSVQNELLRSIRAYALNHTGHLFTPGVHYKLVEPQFFLDRGPHIMDSMTWAHATRYAIRAVVAAVVVPLPWQAQSTFTRAYLVEHMMWYGIAALLPIGIWVGWRYNATATFVMTAYILLMGLGIALRSGNVGTLVRHRGLVLPFIICLSAVAACHLLAKVSARAERVATPQPAQERT